MSTLVKVGQRTYFKKNEKSLLLLDLCKLVFAFPANNCFVERIFSVMGNIWTDERNRLLVNMVKAELLVHFNFSMNCSEFSKYLNKDSETNKNLLEAAILSQKYKFKNKK